ERDMLPNLSLDPATEKADVAADPTGAVRPWDPLFLQKGLLEGAQKGLKELFPLRNEQVELSLPDIRVARRAYTPEDEYEAVVSGHTLSIPLYGTFVLRDRKTQEVLGEEKRILAYIPWITPRGTLIYRGNEYVIANQLRLKPSIYTRRTQGGLLEAILAPQTAFQRKLYRLRLDPA
ncbi:unnamed protein product, partial [marine sediment metagenome]